MKVSIKGKLNQIPQLNDFLDDWNHQLKIGDAEDWRPTGLCGCYKPSRILRDKKKISIRYRKGLCCFDLYLA